MHHEDVPAAYEMHDMPAAARVRASLGAGIAVAAHDASIRMADGREIVDFATGGFGYGHPHVRERVAAQFRTLPLSTRMFLSRPLALLAKRLADLTPGDLAVTYPCNSGAEAVEGALKLAHGYSRSRPQIVAAAGSYHGSMLGALSICGIAALRRPLQQLALAVRLVPHGDAAAMERAVDERTMAVIVEPVACHPGVRVPPPGYLRAVRELCTASKALLITDEVTTGLGRTGAPFAVDHDGVVPDILVLGGALGGGVLPVAAYVATREVNNRVYGKRDPVLHGSTTGGNPAACVAALAALDVMENEHLPTRCLKAGRRIVATLKRCHAHHPAAIVEWSGRGLLAGLRLCDRETAWAVQRNALARGVLVRHDNSPGGATWIGIRPPLLVTPAELERGLDALEWAVCDAVALLTAAAGTRI